MYNSYTQNGYPYDGRIFISYKGYIGTVPAVNVTNSLSGGKNNTTPVVTHKIIRNSSTNIVFDPVDYRFLSTVSQNPVVKVKTNNVTATCMASNNCNYEFSDMFKIIDMTLTGS